MRFNRINWLLLHLQAIQKVLEIGRDFPLNPPEGVDCIYVPHDDSTTTPFNETLNWASSSVSGVN